jgi:hypothetical protein
MPVTIFMNEAGGVWIENPQGDLLAECFFKAEDETAEELKQMGYPSLSECYPAAQIAAGKGIAVEDMTDLFLESWPVQRRSRPRRTAPVPADTAPAASPCSTPYTPEVSQV